MPFKIYGSKPCKKKTVVFSEIPKLAHLKKPTCDYIFHAFVQLGCGDFQAREH